MCVCVWVGGCFDNNNNKFALLIEVENKQANNPLIALSNLTPTCSIVSKVKRKCENR